MQNLRESEVLCLKHMNHIKAVLFDMDGTLLDTKEFIFLAWEHVMHIHNLPNRTREDIVACITKPIKEIYNHLFPDHDHAPLFESHRIFQEANPHLVKRFEKTLHTLEALRARKIPLAVVSTRGRESILRALEAAEITHFFDVIVGTEDTDNYKPHPEPILRALKDLGGIRPEDAIMIGDTDADVLAGKSAGVRTIGVTYGFHGQEIEKHEPDYLVDDIADVLPIILGSAE